MVKIEIELKSFLVRVQVYIIFFFLSKLRDKFSGVSGKIFLFFYLLNVAAYCVYLIEPCRFVLKKNDDRMTGRNQLILASIKTKKYLYLYTYLLYESLVCAGHG